MNDIANFSTDMLRISYWIFNKNDSLAKNFLEICKKNYGNINSKVGCYQNVWEEINRIGDFENDRLHAAERALTLSRILLMYREVSI